MPDIGDYATPDFMEEYPMREISLIPDPFNLPGKMDRWQLEAWILFSMAVAGKGAKVIEKKITAFLEEEKRVLLSPFGVVKSYIQRGQLVRKLKKHKLGKYTLLNKGFRAAVDLDLQKMSLEQLDAVPGIGPKSARMILMYAFPGVEYAVLDTHVLKWLKKEGYTVPNATPDGKIYEKLEKIVLEEARKRNMTARQFDTMVWKMYARQ